MTRATNSQVRLVQYPVGVPTVDCFEVVAAEVPTAGPGQILVEVCDLSLDPYLRTSIKGTHLGEVATPLGELMPGRSVARVLQTIEGGPEVGSFVLTPTGWQEIAAVHVDDAEPVASFQGVPPSAALGALGMPGLTAYAAITRQLKPRIGETVVISSATGGVGAVAGQLARLSGAHTIAIVGSQEKADLAREKLGYDEAVVRTQNDWADKLKATAPEGVDCYLHSGDSEVLGGVLRQLAIGARITLCGLMDQYNDAGPSMMAAGAIIAARAVVYGMVVYDHNDLADEQIRRIAPLIASGDIKLIEDRVEGLAKAPEAFVRLMSGLNTGKAIVEVATCR